MVGSLRSIAGTSFSAVDLIATRHETIPAEQIVLDRYVFLSHVRTGIAAGLDTAFAWGCPDRGSLTIKVPVNDDRGALSAEMTVHVHGPASVLEIDAGQVIRVYPQADAANAEVEDFAQVEFDRPDLPWMFTPAAADAAGRLVPWITLVVTRRNAIRWGARRGATREADIRRDQLQPLGDAWAWAHAQVMGAKDSGPSLEQRLNEANAAQNLSRLICPRRLEAMTEYVACVVPTFRCGADAGLGLTPASATLEPAWGSSSDPHSGDPAAMVKLPVYFSWAFTTGESGNFESLARLLKPAVAPAGVGRRRVDASQPWSGPGLPLDPDAPGAEIIVEGPVVSLQKPADDPAGGWPPDTPWDDDVTLALVERLNLHDKQAHEEIGAEERPVVGPPLYGSMHAAQPVIQTEAVAAAAQPAWFRELNTDPRNRIVGGLGTRVIQAEQEDLMVSAWNQVMGVEAANRTLRLAQLAMHVSASLHVRHVARFNDSALLAVTERVHAKLLDAPQRSVWASVMQSSLPTSTTVGAFRRMAAFRGRVARRALPGFVQRAASVQALTVATDRLTVNWVRTYRDPDGIAGVSAASRTLLTAKIASTLDPAATPDTLAERWSVDLARAGMPDALVPEALIQARIPDRVDLTPPLIQSLVARVVAAMPSVEVLRRNTPMGITLASNALLLRELTDAAVASGVGRIPVSHFHVRRLELAVRDAPQGVDVAVDAKVLRAFADRAIDMARSLDLPDMPWEAFEQSAKRLRKVVDSNSRIDARTAFAGLSAMSKKIVATDPYVDPPRDRLDVPALQLVRALDPKITVPHRLKARLAAGSGIPTWMRPDWVANGRVEPVMAHPHFHYPMYEPLNRYDRDWMVPGLGLIKQGEMVTVLETNNRFIEAYMVGLNQEMARELLWRGYPTDQRGTYFDSFWTGQRELIADLHELPWRGGALATHVDPKLQGRLAFLVRGELIRRYPGVVAHVVRQATDDKGQLLTDNGVPIFEDASDLTPRKTLFHIVLPPNVLIAGFDLASTDLATPRETWWFTLSENPTEPRFGLDDSRQGAIGRDSLVFNDFALAPGNFLDATQAHPAVNFSGSQWGTTSAQIAYLLFQLPARAAFLAARMAGVEVPRA